MHEKLEEFRALVEEEMVEYMIGFSKRGGFQHDTDHIVKLHGESAIFTHIRPGKKYTKIDVGNSGKYMVVNDTGEIFGIKTYGVIHRGHQYGTLDTINEWEWGGYTAKKK